MAIRHPIDIRQPQSNLRQLMISSFFNEIQGKTIGHKQPYPGVNWQLVIVKIIFFNFKLIGKALQQIDFLIQ